MLLLIGKYCKKISLLPVHPVFTLSYRHLSAASGIFRLPRDICLGHVYTWMSRKHMDSFCNILSYLWQNEGAASSVILIVSETAAVLLLALIFIHLNLRIPPIQILSFKEIE